MNINDLLNIDFDESLQKTIPEIGALVAKAIKDHPELKELFLIINAHLISVYGLGEMGFKKIAEQGIINLISVLPTPEINSND